MKVVEALAEFVGRLVEEGATGVIIIHVGRHEFEILRAAHGPPENPYDSENEIVVHTPAGRALVRLDPDL